MSEQMFNMANRISAKLDTYTSGVRFIMVMDVKSFGKMRLSDNPTTTNAYVGVQYIAPSFYFINLRLEPFTATIAAAATLLLFGGCFPNSRRAVAKIAPQQFAPVLSPPLCQYGGASRACR